MDVQIVSSCHGLAYYVCSYIAKCEPDDLKQALSDIVTKVLASPTPVSVRQHMMLVGNCILKTRRLSAQEAAARIGHLRLSWSSRRVINLNTKPCAKRYKILKPLSQREDLPDNSTEIFHQNMIDYYHQRPDELAHISLFRFASWYKLADHSVKNPVQPRFHLKQCNKVIQKRTKPCVIRTPKVERLSDDYFYSLLLLHLPHTDENSIIHPYSTAEEALFINTHSWI